MCEVCAADLNLSNNLFCDPQHPQLRRARAFDLKLIIIPIFYGKNLLPAHYPFYFPHLCIISLYTLYMITQLIFFFKYFYIFFIFYISKLSNYIIIFDLYIHLSFRFYYRLKFFLTIFFMLQIKKRHKCPFFCIITH